MVNLYTAFSGVSKNFIFRNTQSKRPPYLCFGNTNQRKWARTGEASNVADAQTLSDGPDSTHYAISSLFISIYYLICLRAFLVCLLIFCIYSQSVQLAGFNEIVQSTSFVYRSATGGSSQPVQGDRTLYWICAGMVPVVTIRQNRIAAANDTRQSYETAIKRIATTPHQTMVLPSTGRAIAFLFTV